MCWTACLFVWHRPLAVADFRREYQIADLSKVSAVEFAQLVIGLSRRSEVMRKIGGDPEEQMMAAISGARQTTQPGQQQRWQKPRQPVPTGEQYIKSARRLHGKVHVVRRGETTR
jgi:hypothetical protein